MQLGGYKKRPIARRDAYIRLIVSILIFVSSFLYYFDIYKFDPAPTPATAGDVVNKQRKTATIEIERPGIHGIEHTLKFLESYLLKLHDWQNSYGRNELKTLEIWDGFHKLVSEIIIPWDRSYLKEMKTLKRRHDGSIFLSVASYRDENCLPTLKEAYKNSGDPEKLNVGLVQQNCMEKVCKTGVLEGGKVEDTEPDQDCYDEFCKSEYGEACRDGRIRVLKLKETESLGPYFARWLGSKLWNGEDWYMQIDSHMKFAKDWDKKSVEMLKKAPSDKPVITNYPPGDQSRLPSDIGLRICDPLIAPSEIEGQIVRLEASLRYDQHDPKPIPRFAPFVAAGYFVAHSKFLVDVPFDPLLPWIFMGEEISLSARLWTSGYDMFSPTQDVTSHIYVRRHKPKFWETFNRAWGGKGGGHNALQLRVLDRVKSSLGYPECTPDMVHPKSLLDYLDEYSMGTVRPLETYLDMTGLDFRLKLADLTKNKWCRDGKVPPQYGEKREALQKIYDSV